MPSTNTNFPSVPVFQPSTDTVGPSGPEPEYQPMNDESASVRPATQVAWPAAATSGGVSGGRDRSVKGRRASAPGPRS